MPLLGENASVWPGYMPPEEIEAARMLVAEEQGMDPSIVPPGAVIDRWMAAKSHQLPPEFPAPTQASGVSVHPQGTQLPVSPLFSPPVQSDAQALLGVNQPAPANTSTPEQTGKIVFPGQNAPVSSVSGRGVGLNPLEQAARQIQALPGRFNRQMEESRKSLTSANQKVQTAIQNKANLAASTAEAEADILRGGIDAFKKIQTEEQQKVDNARNQVESSFGQYQQAKEKLAGMQVNPNRVLSSAGSKIGAAIAIMLGAVGQGLAGGRNQGLDSIQNAINQDIQAQMAAIDNQRGIVSANQSEVGLARQIFSDTESQKLAAESAHWQGVKLRTQSLIAQNKSPEIQANAAELLAHSGQKQEQLERELLERQFQLELQGRTAQLGAAKSVVGAQLQAVKATQKQSAPPGLTPIGNPTKEDRTKATAFTSNYNRAADALDSLVAWRKEYSAEFLDRKAIEKGKALTSRAIIAMKRADDMGANFTEMEKELVGLSDDPGKVGFYLDRLKAIRASIEREANGFLKPYGYTLTSSSFKKKGNQISQ